MILEKTTRRRKTIQSNNIPFTYHIAWSELGIHYYGSRYSWDCHPDDLWTTYFTSSDIVKLFREVNGEPDIIEVRKIFINDEWNERVKQCVQWESRVLRKLGVVPRKDWLNENYGDGKFYSVGRMPAKNAITGEYFGPVDITDQRVLSGELVHHLTGQKIKMAKCQFCHNDLLVSILRDHEKYCSENPNKIERECCFCFQKFTDRRNHKRHERHCELNPNKEDLPEYECQYCDKIYYDNGKRKDHENHCSENPTRTDKLLRACQYCKKEYVGIGYHEIYCDSNPNKIILPLINCQFCNKEFQNTGALSIHESECSENPNKKNLDCPFCNKEFTDTRNSVRHIRHCELNPDKEPRPSYFCQFCNKKYERLKKLKSHEESCKHKHIHKND